MYHTEMITRRSRDALARLKLHFLGPMEAYIGEELIRFATKKTVLLLAYLVTFRDRAHPRQTLAGLFWGEASERNANNSLRFALMVLRKALPSPRDSLPYLIATGGSLRFNERSPFELDTLTLQAAIDRVKQESRMTTQSADALARALKTYRGLFLEGFFDDWVAHEQMHWQDRFIQGVLLLSQFYEQRREYDRVIELCQHALHFCPHHEALWCSLIRAHALHGDRNAALSQYERFVQSLRAEMDLEPLAETQSLYEQIATNRLQPPSHRGYRVINQPPTRLNVS